MLQPTAAQLARINAHHAIKAERWRRKFEAHTEAIRNSEATPEHDHAYSSCVYKRRPNPAWYFLYGALADSGNLAQAVGIDQVTTRPALIENQSIRYLDHRAGLCSGKETVEGVLWYAPSTDAVHRLREYMTDACGEFRVRARRQDDGKMVLVEPFFWTKQTVEGEQLTKEPFTNL